MNVTVIGKNINIGDAFRNHIESKIEEVVGKYFGQPLDATVVLVHDAHLYRASLSARAGRQLLLQSSGDATEPYPAFDLALERLGKRLRRHKRRIKDHNRLPADDPGIRELTPARQYILDPENATSDQEPGEEGDQPVIVAEMNAVIETLTVGEAVMQMDLGEIPAVLFRSRVHGGLNMVYRRPDGHIGWIDPAAKPATG